MKASRNGAILFAIGCLVGCGKVPTSSETYGIIGQDQRIVATADLEELVGHLSTPQGPCTAFVSDVNEITTAEHCVNTQHQPDAYAFVTGSGSRDVAILALNIDSSNHIARLKTKDTFKKYLELGSVNQGAKATVAGFDPIKKILVMDSFCDVSSNPDGLIKHTCDTVPGQSGSPILQDNKVIGVHQGYLLSAKKNVGTLLNIENRRPNILLTNLKSLALEVDCSTNCEDHCERRILGRKVRNYICEGACNAERGLSCGREQYLDFESRLKNDNVWGECVFDIAMGLGTADLCGACVAGITASTGGAAILACSAVCVGSATFFKKAKEKCGW